MSRAGQRIAIFGITGAALIVLFYVAVCTGGLKVSPEELINGLFFVYDRSVEIIVELRLPRIIIAIIGGAVMSVSGMYMQAAAKNPLADPGIIGVSAGAALASAVVTVFVPRISPANPLVAFLGGMTAFVIVYLLAWNDKTSPVRFVLVGIAVNAVFTGLYSALDAVVGGGYLGVSGSVSAAISIKSWDDVRMFVRYALIAAVICPFTAKMCNLLSLSDHTIHSLGANVRRSRFLTSLFSVFLAAIFTAIIGPVSFLGLIVPHMSRLLVGSDHHVLIPYNALLGAFIFLLADTLGRGIAYPYEISASIVMSVIGGPVFIILLKKGGKGYGA